ncbi:hypothetical protein GCM10020000_28910 [Streptomyces olivoverticillatus]
MSEKPAGTAGRPEESAAASAMMWQNSPPGSLYDHIRVASFSLGTDGRIEQWSTRAAELFGITARQAVGRDPQEVFAPSTRAAPGTGPKPPSWARAAPTAAPGRAWCPTSATDANRAWPRST